MPFSIEYRRNNSGQRERECRFHKDGHDASICLCVFFGGVFTEFSMGMEETKGNYQGDNDVKADGDGNPGDSKLGGSPSQNEAIGERTEDDRYKSKG